MNRANQVPDNGRPSGEVEQVRAGERDAENPKNDDNFSLFDVNDGKIHADERIRAQNKL